MEPNTSWKFKVRQLAQKNTHGVPLFKIKEMMERYEKNINLESLLLEWNLPELKEHEHDCRPDDTEITEEKSSAFKMNEITEEVNAIESHVIAVEFSTRILRPFQSNRRCRTGGGGGATVASVFHWALAPRPPVSSLRPSLPRLPWRPAVETHCRNRLPPNRQQQQR